MQNWHFWNVYFTKWWDDLLEKRHEKARNRSAHLADRHCGFGQRDVQNGRVEDSILPQKCSVSKSKGVCRALFSAAHRKTLWQIFRTVEILLDRFCGRNLSSLWWTKGWFGWGIYGMQSLSWAWEEEGKGGSAPVCECKDNTFTLLFQIPSCYYQ